MGDEAGGPGGAVGLHRPVVDGAAEFDGDGGGVAGGVLHPPARPVAVQAGVSRLAVRLGDPAAEVPVDLQLSTGFVDLYLPASATVEVRVDGFSIDNLGDQGFTRDADAWRAEGSGTGRYLVQIRATAARIRVHREGGGD